MQEIIDLFEKISEEIEGARMYAKCALHFKDIESDRAATYLEMSKQELGHVDRLHAMVVRIIKKYKATGAEVPKEMQVLYDWQHAKMIECVAKVRDLHAMYSK